MRHKLGLIIACMLGIWGCICIKLSKLDIGSTSRLRKAFQSGSPQVDISEEWRRATGSGTTGGREEGYHDSPRLRVTAGVNGSEPSRVDHRTPPRIVVKDTHSGRNDECQAVLDDRGNPSNLFTDPVLSMAKPTYGVVSGGEYSYYTVCISQHRHHHRIDLELIVKRGEADLYVSASEAHPRVERGSTWISATQGDDHISLPTYTEGFLGMKPSLLYVGVHGRPGGKYSLGVSIVDVGDREMAAHMPIKRHPK